MSQQANNVEFFCHNVKFEYRNYFCSKNEKDNLKFDVIKKNIIKKQSFKNNMLNNS